MAYFGGRNGSSLLTIAQQKNRRLAQQNFTPDS